MQAPQHQTPPQNAGGCPCCPITAFSSRLTATADLAALAFKVPPAFRRRFRQRAADADLKLNELLFAALEAWEQKNVGAHQ